uniref:Putative secreted protein n=1 Tax=Anopheles triannulatus TaxID=58253 RepID=A0A2M4B684_9DIPT
MYSVLLLLSIIILPKNSSTKSLSRPVLHIMLLTLRTVSSPSVCNKSDTPTVGPNRFNKFCKFTKVESVLETGVIHVWNPLSSFIGV